MARRVLIVGCSDSPAKPDPSRARSGPYASRWRVLVNVAETEWQPARVS